MKKILLLFSLILSISSFAQTQQDKELTAEEKKKNIAQKRYEELKKRSERAKKTLESQKNAFQNDTIDYGKRDQEIMKNIFDRYKSENDSLKKKEEIYQSINL